MAYLRTKADVLGYILGYPATLGSVTVGGQKPSLVLDSLVCKMQSSIGLNRLRGLGFDFFLLCQVPEGCSLVEEGLILAQGFRGFML